MRYNGLKLYQANRIKQAELTPVPVWQHLTGSSRLCHHGTLGLALDTKCLTTALGVYQTGEGPALATYRTTPSHICLQVLLRKTSQHSITADMFICVTCCASSSRLQELDDLHVAVGHVSLSFPCFIGVSG